MYYVKTENSLDLHLYDLQRMATCGAGLQMDTLYPGVSFN